MLVNSDKNATVDIKKAEFLANFNLLNELSVNLKLPLDVLDDECNLVGVYFSRPAYAKLVKQVEKLKNEINKLEDSRKGQDEQW